MIPRHSQLHLMELAYVAHSERCALLLDQDGVCRWVVPKVDSKALAALVKRCVGAQFVASLDPDAAGLLGHDPTVGKNILLARVDEGRVSLVRFGPLVRFDRLSEPKVVDVPCAAVDVKIALPRPLVLVPEPSDSEPATVPGRYPILDDEEELATVGEERPAYRPSGFVMRAASEVDGVDSVDTLRFTRSVIIREAKRGVPH
jgi:hypothetical protein